MTCQEPSLMERMYELYQTTYSVYLLVGMLRDLDHAHELIGYIRLWDDEPSGRMFLRRFGQYEGGDPPLSVLLAALRSYERQLKWAIEEHRSRSSA